MSSVNFSNLCPRYSTEMLDGRVVVNLLRATTNTLDGGTCRQRGLPNR